MRVVQVPFPFFNDIDGSALEDGFVYIGEAGLNPVTNPVEVFADNAKTIPVAQPIRTLAGYMANYGSPINVFTSGNYSMVVKNKNGELVYSIPDSGQITTGGNDTQNAVDDFGAVGDGTTDNFPAFSEIFSQTSGKIFIPAGVYNIDSMVTINAENVEICGARGQTIIKSSNLSKLFDIVRMENVRICNITFVSESSNALPFDGVLSGSSAILINSIFTWCEIKAELCNTGGWAINGTSTIDKFFFINNVIKGVGAKGVLFSGTTIDGLKLDLNVIQDTGLFAGSDGSGLCLGDNANSVAVSDTTLINTKTNAVYVYNCSDVVIENLISTGNIGVCGAKIDNADDIKLTDCFFNLSDFFLINDSNNLRASNINIKSTAVNAVKITGDSQFNEIHLGTFDNSTSADNVDGCVVLSDGVDVKNNRLSHLKMEPRTGKPLVKGINLGKQCVLIHCYSSTGGDIVDSDLLDWDTFALATDAGLILEKQAKYQVMDGVVHCFFRIEVLEDAGVTSGTFVIYGLPVTPDRTLMGEDTDPIIRAQRFLMTGAATISNVSELPSPTKSYYIPEYQHIAEDAPLPAEDRIFLHLLSGDASTDMSTWRDKLLLVGSFSYPAAG